jgi:hypothetical protein
MLLQGLPAKRPGKLPTGQGAMTTCQAGDKGMSQTDHEHSVHMHSETKHNQLLSPLAGCSTKMGVTPTVRAIHI